jgi:hypothetical protein
MPDERGTNVLSLSYAASPCDVNQLRRLRRIAEVSVTSNGSSGAEPAFIRLTRLIHLTRPTRVTRFPLHCVAPKQRSMRCSSTSRV